MGRTRSTNRGLILLLQIMTPYIQQQLKSYAIIQIGMTICSVDKIYLANFPNEDQGYESGISMYGHYIACKCPGISSEEEYMNQLTDIRIPTNELEPC